MLYSFFFLFGRRSIYFHFTSPAVHSLAANKRRRPPPSNSLYAIVLLMNLLAFIFPPNIIPAKFDWSPPEISCHHLLHIWLFWFAPIDVLILIPQLLFLGISSPNEGKMMLLLLTPIRSSQSTNWSPATWASRDRVNTQTNPSPSAIDDDIFPSCITGNKEQRGMGG